MSSKWEICSDKKTENLGDMFGIFFEDINHAADGGCMENSSGTVPLNSIRWTAQAIMK